MYELASDGEIAYTDRGQMVGHIVIGVQMLDEKIRSLSGEAFPDELRLHLEHLICSHHGLQEYGSPKIPLTLEAVALHHIDNLDAKLASYTSVIQTDVSGDPNWTNYHPSIGRKLLEENERVKPPAVVLLSGGLDSATCLAIAVDQGFAPHSISFRYGQRHEYELQRAAEISPSLGGASHQIIDIDWHNLADRLWSIGHRCPQARRVDEIATRFLSRMCRPATPCSCRWH